jgi:hypothetical protein
MVLITSGKRPGVGVVWWAWQNGASNRALTLALACLLDANPAAGFATPCERLIHTDPYHTSILDPHLVAMSGRLGVRACVGGPTGSRIWGG